MSADDGAGLDKAPLPKPTATFSSFINKNTTGKKFAPKAARRRPAPSSTPAPATELPDAPAVAQEPPAETAPVPLPSASVAAVATTAVSVEPLQPLEQPPPQAEQVSQEEVLPQSQPVPLQEEAATQEVVEPAAIVQTVEPATDSVVTQPTSQTTETQPPRRRRLPWVAVNHPQGNDDAAKKTRQPTGSQKGGDIEEAEQDDAESDEGIQPAPKRLSAKAHGKRKATTANAEDDADIQPPPKRVRRPRKAKGKATAGTGNTAEDDVEVEVDGGKETVTRRKPRQGKRKKQATEEGDENAQPKKKGRPPRQATPSDAEDEVIDPELTFMDGLASRNIRTGRLSEREKQMREIDWVAVRQRQKEEANRPIKSKKELEEADKALAEAGTQSEMRTQVHLVNGQIQVMQDSGTVNRQADAQREIDAYEVMEDRDITTRINTGSFIKNNKRFPNEFILPGNGRKWTKDLTDLFYQGLRSFGTDFQMISHMFPGFTRRAIKTKFTREEREHPERVKEALHGQSEIDSHWDTFLSASHLDEDKFADADKIKQELAEEEARFNELIKAAELETKERQEQRRLAGVSDDEAPSGEKRRQKKKGKEKQVSPVEEGVEIVEYLE